MHVVMSLDFKLKSSILQHNSNRHLILMHRLYTLSRISCSHTFPKQRAFVSFRPMRTVLIGIRVRVFFACIVQCVTMLRISFDKCQWRNCGEKHQLCSDWFKCEKPSSKLNRSKKGRTKNLREIYSIESN